MKTCKLCNSVIFVKLCSNLDCKGYAELFAKHPKSREEMSHYIQSEKEVYEKRKQKNKLFATEEDLVNKFCDFFQKYKLEKEVKVYKQKTDRTFTDVVLTTNDIRIAFEAKLNNIWDVWVQAVKNKKLYDYSYVVLPLNKKSILLKKHLKHFQKYQIGIVLVNNENYEFLHKVESIL